MPLVGVEISEETIDSLVKDYLEDTYETIKSEINIAKSGDYYIPWKYKDKCKDIKYMEKLLKAYKFILKEY